MKLSYSAFLAFAASTMTTEVNAADGFFTYSENTEYGPSNWAKVDVADNQCAGTGTGNYGQSPVAVISEDKCETDMSAYKFTGGDCTWDDLDYTISNTGVKAAPKEGSTCSFGKMTIPHTPNEFNALQYHIHTSSEHTIEGQYFDAELHVVHQESTEESFAVFGTMMTTGDEDHPVFENFLRGWEKTANAIQTECQTAASTRQTTFTPLQTRVQCPAIGAGVVEELPFDTETTATPNVYELPTDPDFGVYTYKGGLTTPPCTEIVNWNLLDKPMVISQGQMDRLYSLVLCYINAETCAYATVASEEGSTSRPPQPLNGREIIHRCRTCDGCEIIVDQAPSDNSTVPEEEEEETPTGNTTEPEGNTTTPESPGSGAATFLSLSSVFLAATAAAFL